MQTDKKKKKKKRTSRTVREEIEGKREDLVRRSRRVMESEGDTSLLNAIFRAIAGLSQRDITGLVRGS